MTQLQAIQRVRSLVDGELVQDYEHRWARDERGRLWVRKRERDIGVEVLAAEIIGWHLARHLDAPVPDAAVYRSDADRYATSFLSAAVQPALHWDIDKEIFLNNLEDLGNVLALDAIILNGDRHARNLLLEPDPDELHLRLWAIDTGNALVGSPADFLAHADDVPVPISGLGLPVARVRQRVVQTAQQAMLISRHHLARVVQEASEITDFSDLARIIDVLEDRCQRAPELVSRYLSRWTGAIP